MLTTRQQLTEQSLTLNPTQTQTGISSLFAAAVVSRSFCEMLLREPEAALQQGYMGKRFDLSPEVTALIISIDARTLPDLAQQVVSTLAA